MNLPWNYRQLLTVLLLAGSSSLHAQIRLAALGGIHASSLIEKNNIPGFDTASGKYYSSRTGFELGFMAEIPLENPHLFIQPGLLYSAKGNQYQRYYDSSLYQNDTLYNQHTLKLSYVEMPVYLTWKSTLSKKDQRNKFYLSLGGYLDFIYGASQSYQDRVLPYNSAQYIYQSGSVDLNVGNGYQAYKTFDIGVGARAGFELGNVLIGAYFSQGLTNAYHAGYPSSFHNQVFGGSFGIWLNKPNPAPEPEKDTDGDGIPDRDDYCKTVPGPPRWHGCPIPDSDHDGVNDEEDSCKNVPGLARYHGCPIPDMDNDGINDEEDSCKTVPGVARYHGCPIPDRDRDGVNDEIDKCPDQPGPAENLGCPLVVLEINKQAERMAASLLFENNSSALRQTSYAAVKELADSLKTNPDLDLLIEGFTDNTGKEAYNMKLSLARAASVQKQLLASGIAENRIEVKGYGDTRPIADNSTEAGRTKNRRVVCTFRIKNR